MLKSHLMYFIETFIYHCGTHTTCLIICLNGICYLKLWFKHWFPPSISRASYNSDWPQEVCCVLGESIQSLWIDSLHVLGESIQYIWIDSLMNRFIPPWIDSLGNFPGKPDLGILNRSFIESIQCVHESIHILISHNRFSFPPFSLLSLSLSHSLSLSLPLSITFPLLTFSPSHILSLPLTPVTATHEDSRRTRTIVVRFHSFSL